MALRYSALTVLFAIAGWLVVPGTDAFAPAPAAPPSASSASSGAFYLALGDSLAAGMQPDARGHDRPTNHGYVNVVARSLARSHPGLSSRTLSCGGATAVTLVGGGESCRPDGDPGQLKRAEALLAAHPETVLVTVNIGDNDIEACIDGDDGTIDQACLSRGEARIRRNLPEIAARLRAATPAAAPVIGLVDYDQFLSLWLQGANGRRAARRSLGLIAKLNGLMSSIYREADVEVADASTRFATTDMTHRRALRGHGTVPLAVYNICTLTWACSPEPIGHDDHARPAGYYQLGEAILDVLHAPH